MRPRDNAPGLRTFLRQQFCSDVQQIRLVALALALVVAAELLVDSMDTAEGDARLLSNFGHISVVGI